MIKTIIENIKSFFAKEEELEQEPKPVPRTASDIYERPIAKRTKEERIEQNNKENTSHNESPLRRIISNENERTKKNPIRNNERIIEHKLPKKLPFKSADLREQLRKKEELTINKEPTINKKSRANEQRKIAEPEEEKEIISIDELKAFEQAISELPIEPENKNQHSGRRTALYDEYDNPETKRKYLESKEERRKILEGGFFSEYEKHLLGNEFRINPGELTGEALIRKLNQYHEQKLAGKEYFIHREELAEVIKRKIADLKEYEYEWIELKEREESIKRAIRRVEEEITKKSEELTELLEQMNNQPLITTREPIITEQKNQNKKNNTGTDTINNTNNINNINSTNSTNNINNTNNINSNNNIGNNDNNNGESDKNRTAKENENNNPPFYLANGTPIRSIDELRKALKEMDDSIFYKHVTTTKNDFAEWIEKGIGNQKLAQEVRKATNKYELLNKLNHPWA